MNIRFKALLAIMFVAACWASCKKNDDAPAPRFTTNLNVVNASINNINFYLNGTRLNNTSIYYPGGTLGYIQVPFGTQNFQVRPAGSTDVLFSKQLTLDTAKKYSLYVSGETADQAFYAEDIYPTQAISPDSCLIRFVNASPDAGSLNLTFETGTPNAPVVATQIPNIAYQSISDFKKVKSGTINLGIYQASSSTSVSRDTVTLNGGSRYTVFSYGKAGQAAPPVLSTGVILNQ